MAILTITKNGKKFSVNAKVGETVFDALVREKIAVHSPCGGAKLCKKCLVKAYYGLAPMEKGEAEFLSDQNLAEGLRLACHAKISGDCEIEIPSLTQVIAETDFSNEIPADIDIQKGCGVAFDIGTTTVVGYLYNLETGEQLSVVSERNEQYSAGDDVISRITFAQRDDGQEFLRLKIINQINAMISCLCVKSKWLDSDVVKCTIAANTTMLHLLAGLSPHSIAVAPFTPLSLFGTVFRGEQLGINVNGDVFLMPCVSAYVGSDITAGATAFSLDFSEQTIVFLDIGTNGETVLAHKGKLYCCSTAAGPAFEGAHIKYGVAGVPGAICSVLMSDNKVTHATIGNKKAVGICGSGLIDAIAVMLENDLLDESGYLEEPFYITKDICITPQDIREVQLAKSAVCSGIYRLLELAECDINDVDKLILAGGFGTHLNRRSAAKIGLIPPELESKTTAVGNAAGKGAIMALLSQKFSDRCMDTAENMTYIELSEDIGFTNLFVENMMFNI